MNKIFYILAALVLIMSLSAAGKNISTGIIGGADGPTAIYVTDGEKDMHSTVLSFDGNETTGYRWTAFIVGGDSVEIDETASGYVSDPNEEKMDGAGGKHYFKINAVKPGESIIRFAYARGWEDSAIEETYILADVDDDLNIFTMDVTESGVYDGTVTEVNEKEHSVLLTTQRAGEVIARFDDNETLPAKGETITIYTNGIMTMSLPGIVNVIAWNSVPAEIAR